MDNPRTHGHASVPFTACTWTGTEFLACGLGLDKYPTIYTSPDGDVWTLRDTTIKASLRAATTINGTIYVAGDSVIEKSTDGGTTWTDTFNNYRREQTLHGHGQQRRVFDCRRIQSQCMGNATIGDAIMQNVKSGNPAAKHPQTLTQPPYDGCGAARLGSLVAKQLGLLGLILGIRDSPNSFGSLQVNQLLADSRLHRYAFVRHPPAKHIR